MADTTAATASTAIASTSAARTSLTAVTSATPSLSLSLSSSIAAVSTPTSVTASTSVFTSTSAIAPGTTSTFTSTATASTTTPSTTEIITSFITQSADGGSTSSIAPVTVIITSTAGGGATSSTVGRTSTHASSSTSTPSSLSGSSSGSSSSTTDKGLSTGATVAIAVVVPVVVVALLVLAAIFLWRKRKAKKEAEEARRQEVHDYGFNPNNDPTLPVVAAETGTEMTEDHSSGYRGWGAAVGSNRKASTTLSGGHTQGQLSDLGSPGYPQGSPGLNGSDGHSGDMLVNNRETMGSDELAALGAGPAIAAGGIRRGPSNASSAYSNGAHSEGSEEPMPAIPPGQVGQAYDYNPNVAGGYGYGQHGPYGDGSYGGGQQEGGMPVVRDVSARRNTRIQQGGTYQQGNSGIAQNF